ncbi:MAG: hypothetical protein AABW83_01225 [Nanoarchaeota archaeon]
MKKVLYFFGMLSILLMVISVFAIGSSGSEKIEDKNFRIDDKKDRTYQEKKAAREVCEDIKNREERIKCRLQYIKENKEDFEAPYNKIPESCRNLDFENRGKCVSFYQKSKACYEKKSIEKNKCFKRLANFAKASLKDEKNEKNKKARDYAILLLYDIQQKIEEAIKNDKMDAEAGSKIIEKITEIKEDILAGKPKNEIKPKFSELKNLIKGVKSNIENE